MVENGEIYQAKWYNTGEDPAAQVQYSWQTPWELLGPVLPGDHAPVIPGCRAGTYPAWSLRRPYTAGDKVLYQGLPYEAKWINQGVSPAAESSDPSGSPWKALYSIPGEPSGARRWGRSPVAPAGTGMVPVSSPSAEASPLSFADVAIAARRGPPAACLTHGFSKWT